jgi:DnaJ family protein C protein 11
VSQAGARSRAKPSLNACRSFFALAASQQTLAAPPVIALTYGQRLSPSAPLMGFTSFKTGHYTLGAWGAALPLMAREPPSISVGMTSQDGADSGWTVQSSLALQNQGLSVNWARRVALLGGARISTGLDFGTASGVEAFFNTERRITETLRVTVGVSTGLPRGGVTLNIKANRLGQKVSVPILMAPEYRSDVVGACIVLPVLGFVALEHLYLRPAKRARITDRLRTLREKNRDVIVERRVAAQEAQGVMFASTRTKVRRAWQQGGLVVLEAWYGRRQHFPQATDGDPQALYESVWEHAAADQSPASALEGDVWDVRVPLQALISKGQLLVPGGRAKVRLALGLCSDQLLTTRSRRCSASTTRAWASASTSLSATASAGGCTRPSWATRRSSRRRCAVRAAGRALPLARD